jgi:polysaccharide deacetylase family protein (PEP-CTERM system associated)
MAAGVRPRVCFTFDVEEHHRIEAATGIECPAELQAEYARRMEASTRWLLEALAGFNARATFFVVGQIATTHPKLITDLAAAGHEVACHGWYHRRLHHFTPDEFRADVRRAKHALEQACGQPVIGFRAPTFSITRETAWAIDVLVEEGFRYDSSIFPVRHDRYGIPDAPRSAFRAAGLGHSILELPLATWRMARWNLPAAGGGYFRLFPPAVLRAAVRQLAVPVLYFHPWEFDSEQPRLPLSRMGRFRTYVGMRRTRRRLRRLLTWYESRPMIEAAGEVESRPLPEFRLGGGVPAETSPTPVSGGIP